MWRRLNELLPSDENKYTWKTASRGATYSFRVRSISSTGARSEPTRVVTIWMECRPTTFLLSSIFTAQCTQCQRGIAIVSRPSVCPSETLVYPGNICWTSSKVIARIISLGSSILGATTSATQSKENTPKIRVEQGWVVLSRNLQYL